MTDAQRKRCTCAHAPAEDVQGPDVDCPEHGDPAILGYDPHDRRERYEAAVRPGLESFIKRPWITGSTRTIAEAAMAIADNEVQALKAANGRLRAELAQLRTRAEKAERAVNLLADAHRRAEQAEATIALVEAYAHELRHKDAMGPLAALDGPAGEPTEHAYLSTGCLHGEHGYCQAHTGLSGAKTPAVCKFCKAPCQCPCHADAHRAKEASFRKGA